uniref:Vesicle transport protein USE1 n=1 Tax=Caligus clemensi TaxID=344056 RepID=C1BZW1_CALCM|nr:Vesicle transport protein USE1 [Caligus clemensi]
MKKPIEKSFHVPENDVQGSLSEDEVRFMKILESSESLVSEGTFSGKFDPRIGPFLRRLEGLLFKIGEESSRYAEFSSKLKSLKTFVDEDQLFHFEYDLPNLHKRGNVATKERAVSRVAISPPIIAPDDSVQKEIFRKTVERYRAQDRKELFEGDSSSNPRRRRKDNEDNSTPQSLIHGQEVAQEEIAEQMLSLTKSLKEQTEAANRIIHRDISSLEGTQRTADENIDKLAVESNRLQGHRSTFNCRCWIWVLMFAVVMTFLKMLVVMKLFKKPT